MQASSATCCTAHARHSLPSLPSRRAVAAPFRQAATQQQLRSSVSTSALNFLPGIAASLAIGAAYALQQQQQQGGVDSDRGLEASDRRPCPSCGGSGLTPCACTRWSDGDVGCSSCSESGWSKCSSCGGGGTAVPIRVTVRRDNL